MRDFRIPWKFFWTLSVLIVWVCWIHYLARDPFNVRYYREYLVARCNSNAAELSRTSLSSDVLVASSEMMQECRDLSVSVDGVWGGLYARPAVRLRVSRDGGKKVEFRYFAIAISATSGIASIVYETSENNYHFSL